MAVSFIITVLLRYFDELKWSYALLSVFVILRIVKKDNSLH